MGTSRHLVVAPRSATAALSIGVVSTVSSDTSTYVALTSGLALATGCVTLAAGLLRLGFLASFISEPVLKGFISGLAPTIGIGQVPDLLGVSKGSGNFFEKAGHPSIDVTAAAMLVQLRADLHRMGADLVLADDVGQVRDVLAVAEPDGEPPLYPTGGRGARRLAGGPAAAVHRERVSRGAP